MTKIQQLYQQNIVQTEFDHAMEELLYFTYHRLGKITKVLKDSNDCAIRCDVTFLDYNVFDKEDKVSSVEILYPGSAGMQMRYPVATGDLVLVLAFKTAVTKLTTQSKATTPPIAYPYSSATLKAIPIQTTSTAVTGKPMLQVDKDGAISVKAAGEKLTLQVDKDGAAELTAAGGNFTLKADKDGAVTAEIGGGNGKLTFDKDGKLEVTTSADTTLTAGGNLTIDAGSNKIAVTCAGCDIDAGSDKVTVKSGGFDVNGGNLQVS